MERNDLVEADRKEQMVRLLTKHQEDLFRYIFALLPHEEDARDVLQETSVSLYRKCADYDVGKPFLAWAYGFAYLEVLKQRERNQRGTRHLRPDLVGRLAREREQHDPVLQARLHALDHCLEELAPADQELIRQSYQEKIGAEELVGRFGTSRRTLFRNLDRIRRFLFDCISLRVAAAGPT
jgi:RNA polymerase sigma-70 factor, ECF subfamily